MNTATTIIGLVTFLLVLALAWCHLEIRRLDKQLVKNRAQLRKLNRAINAMSMGLPDSTRQAMVRVDIHNSIDVGTFSEPTKRWPAFTDTNVIPIVPQPMSRIERILRQAGRPMTWTEIVSAAGQISPIDLIRCMSKLREEGRVQQARTFDATPAWVLSNGGQRR